MSVEPRPPDAGFSGVQVHHGCNVLINMRLSLAYIESVPVIRDALKNERLRVKEGKELRPPEDTNLIKNRSGINID